MSVQPARAGIRVAGLLGLAIALRASEAAGQCPQWFPGTGLPGLDGTVNVAIAWDLDGPGPLPPRLAVGGQFTIAGSALAANVAYWDGSAWARLGNGVNGAVSALTALPNGNLIVGGGFTMAGTKTVSGIARWNGTGWSALGAGVLGGVDALITMPNGDVIAGGEFTSAGGIPVNNIARWNGSSWSALGSGLNFPAFALALDPNGTLIVGGRFSTAGGVTANHVATWNGTTWSPLGNGLDWGEVYTLLVLPNGEIITGGQWNGTLSYISQWDGTNWSGLGSGPGPIYALASINGEIVAGGDFDTSPGGNIAGWDGAHWATFGSGFDSPVRSFAMFPNGSVYAGGSFLVAGAVPTKGVAVWSGQNWSTVGSGFDSTIYAQAVLPNGDLIVGGIFREAGGTAAPGLARSDGTNWYALGTTQGTGVYALTMLPNGSLAAGGSFATIGGVAANNIAQWDGSTWTTLGPGFSAEVDALLVLRNGDLLAGGRFSMAGADRVNYIAHWDGAHWSPFGSGLGSGLIFPPVMTMAEMPNGDIVAGGSFDTDGGAPANYIARWDGNAWHDIGGGMASTGGHPTYVSALAVLANGDLVASGLFDTVGGADLTRVVRWDGESWHAMNTDPYGYANQFLFRPNGELLAANLTSSFVARWNGLDWEGIGIGTSSTVSSLALLTDGSISLGGYFTMANGQVSPYWARVSQPEGPQIVAQPQDAFACSRSGGNFSIAASGDGAITYDWQIESPPGNWNSLSDGLIALDCGGTASASAPAAAATAIQVSGCAGSFPIRCVAWIDCVDTLSATVALHVCDNSADLNCNGIVELADLAVLLSNFGAIGVPPTSGDLNSDGVVNLSDLAALLAVFGTACP